MLDLRVVILIKTLFISCRLEVGHVLLFFEEVELSFQVVIILFLGKVSCVVARQTHLNKYDNFYFKSQKIRRLTNRVVGSYLANLEYTQ